MELRHLRYFVAVAEELHFGRAAVRLRMAQPPLSQQIQALERDLGVVLINRTTRRVALTAAGAAFLLEARRVLEQAERAVHTAQRASRGEIGHLAIGFVPSADLDILPRALRLWRKRFPETDIELRALLPGQQVEALRHGQIQLGILRLPVDDRSLVVKSIHREPLMAALPVRHHCVKARGGSHWVLGLRAAHARVQLMGKSLATRGQVAPVSSRVGAVSSAFSGTTSITAARPWA